MTGQLEEGKMQVYVQLGIRLLYKSGMEGEDVGSVCGRVSADYVINVRPARRLLKSLHQARHQVR